MNTGRGMVLVASVVALAALLVADGQGRGGSDPDSSCIEPLPWRVGRIDPRFGVTADEVRDALEAAIALWEEPVRRQLFRHDPERGFPVELVYDARQQELELRQSRIRRLQEAEETVVLLRSDYARRAERLERLVDRHNQAVEAWNEAGGGSDAERARLEAERREIDQLGFSLERAGAALQDAIARYNTLVEESDAGPLRVEAANFEETVRESRGSRTRTRARLVVYQFEGTDELVRLLAHELGHALGIGHLPDPDALMFVEYASGRAGGPGLTDADLAALVERCGAALLDEGAS